MADPDWTQLTHALGRADDLPRLLDNLSPDPNASIWGDICDRAEVTRSDRVYLMSAALTLDGDRVWGRAWEQLHDEVFSGVCLACDADLYSTIGELGCYTTEDFNQQLRRRTPDFLMHTEEGGQS